MHLKLLFAGLLVLLGGASLLPGDAVNDSAAVSKALQIPPVAREFRGVWVATVANIDWPSRPGLPVEQQQAEMRRLLDKAVQLKLNAVLFQVRPACDALYASELEPWSEYLTGQMGRAPSPYYDPLAFAVEEAHKRGLELHAWFNPYRARHPSAKSPLSPEHISKTRPEIVRSYGSYLWLDPGEQGTQDHSLVVILDVVRRYNIDGVHLDDYFYPYKEVDSHKKEIPFPDDASYARYVQDGGRLSRADWRRASVNAFIERLYKAIKAEKPWVKFGISPFGIWRPGYPRTIKGFDAYDEIYADSRKWLQNGWLDYWTPQLYWKISQTGQSYPTLLKWWTQQNPYGRHIWPGNYTGRVSDGSKTSWPAAEVVNQIKATRCQPGATGNVHFSMQTLQRNAGGLCDQLCRDVYAQPALIPASPWLGDKTPEKPSLEMQTDAATGEVRLAWRASETDAARIRLWVVQTHANGLWSTEILPAAQTSRKLTALAANVLADTVAVSAVDRCGNQSTPALFEIKPRTP